MMPTLYPARFIAAASDAVTNDLPTPPFPLTTPITFLTLDAAFIGSLAIPPPALFFALLGHPSQLSFEQLDAPLQLLFSGIFFPP